MKKTINVFLFFILIPILNFGQNFKTLEQYVAYENQTYLSSNNILVDRNGFVWYAVTHGIIKDYSISKLFIPLQSNIEDYSPVENLFEDSKGNIWVACDLGAYIIDPSTYEHCLIQWTENENKKHTKFSCVAETMDSSIWIISFKGHVLNYSNGNLELCGMIQSNDGLEETGWSIISTYGNTLILKDENNTIYSFENGYFTELYNGENSLGSVVLAEGNFLNTFIKEEGFYTYHNEKYNYKYIDNIKKYVLEIPKQTTYQYLKIFRRNLIFVENNQLIFGEIVSKEDGSLELLQKEIFDIEPQLKMIHYNEERNIIWLAYTQKLVKILIQTPNFKPLLTGTNDLRISTRKMVYDSANNLYVASHDGLFKVEALNGKTSKLNIEIYPSSLILENDSILWATSVGYGEIFKINLNSLKYKRYPVDFRGLVMKRKDSETLWLGTTKGLYLVHTKTENITEYNSLLLLSSDINK